MDKVRAFLKAAWIQRFWILSVVGTLAAVVCWMVASGKLQAEFTANKAKIETEFGNMNAIKGKAVHGNPQVNAKEREEAKKIADSVKALWQKLFDAQREEVLKWPEAQLGADFVQEIDKKKFGMPISTRMRDRYLNYIKNRFAGLVEIVDAQKMEDPSAGFNGAMPGREMAMPMESAMVGPDGQPIVIEDYLVQWLDQANLRQQLEFTGVPTSVQIWVTQEDLWVYETLLRVIANTNKERGATRPDNTAIRVIQSLEVGAPAATAMAMESQILMPADAMAGGGGEMPMDMGPVMRPEDGGTGVDVDAALMASRYIDGEGKPIADASAGTGTEFRRLPVRMVLMMDERWLPKVLVECANAPLPIEVQRLRINAEKSGVDKDNQPFDLSGGAGAGGAMGGMPMGRESMSMGRPPSMAMPMGRGGEGMSMGMNLSAADTANLATVEIQGVVYIYMPPDPAVLAVPGDDAASPDALAAGDGAVVR